MPRLASTPINLSKPPEIHLIGLCLHGARREESFRLRGLWSLHAYRYHGSFKMQGDVFDFHRGCVSLIPPDNVVRWTFPTHAPHYCVHFAVPSPASSCDQAPRLTDLEERFDRFCEQFEEMIEYHRSDKQRATVRLWDLLFQLVRRAPAQAAAETPLPFTVRTALSIIQSNLHEKIQVRGMAKTMGVSQSHLNSLFKQQFGHTVHEYIHRNRVERALHLLSDSSLKIKSIAIESGFLDLQHFNKIIHCATGVSPRAYREGIVRQTEARSATA